MAWFATPSHDTAEYMTAATHSFNTNVWVGKCVKTRTRSAHFLRHGGFSDPTAPAAQESRAKILLTRAPRRRAASCHRASRLVAADDEESPEDQQSEAVLNALWYGLVALMATLLAGLAREAYMGYARGSCNETNLKPKSSFNGAPIRIIPNH